MNDLKDVLNETKEEVELKNTDETGDKVRIHKKPIQLRDIENRSSGNRRVMGSHESDEKIKKLLKKEQEEIYKQPWNKLDSGLKINRIKSFVDNESKVNKLNKKQSEDLKNILIKACNANMINKSNDVSYDISGGYILKIKYLTFNSNTKEYVLDICDQKKITKHTNSKSRSNIDRFLKQRK